MIGSIIQSSIVILSSAISAVPRTVTEAAEFSHVAEPGDAACIFGLDVIEGGGSSAPREMIIWDPDGNGPSPELLVVASSYSLAPGDVRTFIGGWDGVNWQTIGTDLPPDMAYSMIVYNGELVVGGSVSEINGVTINKVARWDGSAWQAFGGGIEPSGTVWALAEFQGALIAGGSFHLTSGQTDSMLARWDGADWSAMEGSPYCSPQPPCGSVTALTIYEGELVVSGLFDEAGGEAAHYIAAWDGEIWRSLETDSSILGLWPDAMVVYNGELIANGGWGFPQGSGYTTNRLARWNGESWSPLASSAFRMGFVTDLAVYEGDLIIAGRFDAPVPIQDSDGLIRWNGDRFLPLIGFCSGSFCEVHVLPYLDRLIVSRTGDSEVLLSMGAEGDPPIIYEMPGDQTAFANGPIQISVDAGPGLGWREDPTVYQWRKDGINLSDGAAVGGGTILGARTESLTIDGAGAADVGEYDVIVSNLCGATISAPASLNVLVPSVTIMSAHSIRSCETPIRFNGAGPIVTEPGVGGVEMLNVRFSGPIPYVPDPGDIIIEEKSCLGGCLACGDAIYQVSGFSASQVAKVGFVLTVLFDGGLPNARTYRITFGPNVTAVPNQFVEVRGLVGDINSDGRVNGSDRSMVVSCWTGSCQDCGPDVDNNADVNAQDRSLVVGAWTGTENCAP